MSTRRISCPRPLRRLLISLASLALASCATSNGLNTDRIARQFGNVGVEIIEQSAETRVTSLFSLAGEQKTMRTYAVVDYPGNPREAYRREHEEIVAGGSIGETFRRAGWSIRKQHLFIGELEVPEGYETLERGMRIALPASLAVHQYLFVITREERSWTYATITEVHHPQYLDADALREIYGEILFDDSNRDSIHDFLGPPDGN